MDLPNPFRVSVDITESVQEWIAGIREAYFDFSSPSLPPGCSDLLLIKLKFRQLCKPLLPISVDIVLHVWFLLLLDNLWFIHRG